MGHIVKLILMFLEVLFLFGVFVESIWQEVSINVVEKITAHGSYVYKGLNFSEI